MTIRSFHAYAFLLAIPLAAHAVQTQPCANVLVPKGMPITMTAKQDVSEPEILKFIITRNVPKDARRAKIITVMLDKNGTIKYIRSKVGDQLSDPMSIGTADKSIARILLIVEWLETDKGKWVMDTNDRRPFDVEAFINLGTATLPQATFIKNEVR